MQPHWHLQLATASRFVLFQQLTPKRLIELQNVPAAQVDLRISYRQFWWSSETCLHTRRNVTAT